MPPHKRVAEVAVIAEPLARTQLGKIRRDKLAERFDTWREGERREGSGPLPVEEMDAADRELLARADVRAVWDLLAERTAGTPLSPDTDLVIGLGVDSLEWMNLTLDIRDRTGIELAEEAIARIETVRDLLEAVSHASAARTDRLADVTREPDRFLSDEQRRWLEPLGRGETVLAWILYQLNRLVMKAVFRLRVHGLEHIRADVQTVVLPNHTSYLDGFVIVAALPFDVMRRTVIAGSADIAFATGVHRFVMRLARALPIQHERAPFSSLALPVKALRAGDNLIWFPEGRRSRTGELMPVQPGIARLVQAHPVAATPVIVEGAFEAMPRGRMIPRPRRITVHIGAPIPSATLAGNGEGRDARQRITGTIAHALETLKAAAGRGA
jgi:long-chain acyl-CoA synthetase